MWFGKDNISSPLNVTFIKSCDWQKPESATIYIHNFISCEQDNNKLESSNFKNGILSFFLSMTCFVAFCNYSRVICQIVLFIQILTLRNMLLNSVSTQNAVDTGMLLMKKKQNLLLGKCIISPVYYISWNVECKFSSLQVEV